MNDTEMMLLLLIDLKEGMRMRAMSITGEEWERGNTSREVENAKKVYGDEYEAIDNMVRAKTKSLSTGSPSNST